MHGGRASLISLKTHLYTIWWQFLIHFGAGEPDLSLGSSQRAEVGHLHHGRGEGAAEGRLVGGEVPDSVVRAATVEELLVRVQEPLLAQQVGVVGVVERVRRRRVERRQVAVAGAGRPGAVGLERAREPRVDVGVVVDVVPEVEALRLPDRVRPCIIQATPCIVKLICSCMALEALERALTYRRGQPCR